MGVLEGDTNCINQLGVLYGRGLGVKKDVRAALDFYEMAANRDEPVACRNLGVLYELGDLGEPDLENAVKWYTRGAQLDDEECKERLKELGVSLAANKSNDLNGERDDITVR